MNKANWQKRIDTGYVFKYRWMVSFNDGKLTIIASGDNKQEAIWDADRLNSKLGIDEVAVSKCSRIQECDV